MNHVPDFTAPNITDKGTFNLERIKHLASRDICNEIMLISIAKYGLIQYAYQTIIELILPSFQILCLLEGLCANSTSHTVKITFKECLVGIRHK